LVSLHRTFASLLIVGFDPKRNSPLVTRQVTQVQQPCVKLASARLRRRLAGNRRPKLRTPSALYWTA
jgi:hypothetical protein